MKNTPTKSVPIKPSEITPEAVYLNRRQFIKTIGLVGAGTFLAACTQITPSATTEGMSPQASETTDELGNSLNSYSDITNYNNFYEFTTDKRDVARLSQGFVPNQGEGKLPYQVEVYGLVNKPKIYRIGRLIEIPPGRTNLSPALRRRMVYGHSLEWISTCNPAKRGGNSF